MNKKLILIIAAVVIELIICIVFISDMSAQKDTLRSYQLIEAERSFRADMMEGMRKAVVIKAPLSGTPADDKQGILTRKYDIPSESILYVSYQKEKCRKYKDSDGDTHTEWNTVEPMKKYVSENVFIYNDIPLIHTLPYEFQDNSQYYYPDGSGDRDGNIRYDIHYLTTADSISFVAEIGDGSFRMLDELDGKHFVVNADLDKLCSVASESSFFLLTASVIICIIAVAVIIMW